MYARYVIFAALSVLLGSAIYVSSSTYYISAAKSRSCSDTVSNDGKFRITTCCDIETTDHAVVSVTNCQTTVCPIGGVICGEAAKTAPKVSSDELSQLEKNNTKAPNNDVLKDKGILEEDNGKKAPEEALDGSSKDVPKTELSPDSNLPPLTSNDNHTEPKLPVGPTK
jgi:hypothetical protein